MKTTEELALSAGFSAFTLAGYGLKTLEEFRKLCVEDAAQAEPVAWQSSSDSRFVTTDDGTRRQWESHGYKPMPLYATPHPCTNCIELERKINLCIASREEEIDSLEAEVERLKSTLKNYEKHGVTCQTYGYVIGACSECNTHDEAIKEYKEGKS